MHGWFAIAFANFMWLCFKKCMSCYNFCKHFWSHIKKAKSNSCCSYLVCLFNFDKNVLQSHQMLLKNVVTLKNQVHFLHNIQPTIHKSSAFRMQQSLLNHKQNQLKWLVCDSICKFYVIVFKKCMSCYKFCKYFW